VCLWVCLLTFLQGCQQDDAWFGVTISLPRYMDITVPLQVLSAKSGPYGTACCDPGACSDPFGKTSHAVRLYAELSSTLQRYNAVTYNGTTTGNQSIDRPAYVNSGEEHAYTLTYTIDCVRIDLKLTVAPVGRCESGTG
jgi:hypothetical protein